jgi:hypothetical protein
MRTRPIAFALLLAALAGCDGGAPPLDELPLRDALRADPAVIATLSDDARQRLAARLEAARTGDDSDDAVAGDPATAQPVVLVTEADAARARRSGDALILGTIGAGTARALPNTAAGTPAALPPLEVEATAPALTELESRALRGRGAALLRGLCAVSGANHLRRVVGWPMGAVAIGDTVYVGAAWLAALAPAPSADGGADAGMPAPSSTATAGSGFEANAGATGAATATASAGNDNPDAGGIRATPATDNVGTPYGYDGGVIVVYPPSTPQPPPTSSSDDSCGAAADSCAACSAASTDDSSSCDGSTDDGSDSCDNTDDGSGGADACNNTSDGSTDSCNNTASDGGDDTTCQVSRRSRQHGGTSPRMMLSVFAPLAFLLSRRQRRR